MQVKLRVRLQKVKIKPTNYSNPHIYFTVHLMCVTEKLPRTPNEEMKTDGGGSRIIPTDI
jgi:hypothetical protein